MYVQSPRILYTAHEAWHAARLLEVAQPLLWDGIGDIVELNRARQSKQEPSLKICVCHAITAASEINGMRQMASKVRGSIRNAISPHSTVDEWLLANVPGLTREEMRAGIQAYRTRWLKELHGQFEWMSFNGRNIVKG